jgi:hypothetical protein
LHFVALDVQPSPAIRELADVPATFRAGAEAALTEDNMKKTKQKLALSTQTVRTIRSLSPDELVRAGGAATDNSLCHCYINTAKAGGCP